MVIPPIDTSPPPDALRPKPKSPDPKAKTPEQSKQQKAGDALPPSNTGAEVTVGLDIDQLIERTETVIAPVLIGYDPTDQTCVDDVLQ